MEEKINETAVWERVTAASGAKNRGEGPNTGPIGPELLTAMEHKENAAAAYRQLLSRCGGAGQRTLRRILSQEQQGLQQLFALYYFLTGQRPCLGQLTVARPQESLAKGLQRMMREEELSAGRLEALAARSTGQTQALLLELCHQEQLHFRLLLKILGCCMDP